MLSVNDRKKFKKDLNQIQELTKEHLTDIIFNPNESDKEIRKVIKTFYDWSKKFEDNTNSLETVPELIIDNVDTEHIWQQIDAQNRYLFNKIDLGEKKDENVTKSSPTLDNEVSHSDEDENVNLDSESNMKMDFTNGNEEEDEDDNEFIDEEDENEEDNLYYDDFFGDGDEKSNKKTAKKSVRFQDSLNDSEEELVADKTVKSTFEEREERLRKRIQQFENKMVEDKPWQMKGEITAEMRPVDSLLNDVVDFDTVSRPPPVIAEKTTYTLESIIKQRIIDESWDNVERKVKPQKTRLEFKKKTIVSQEKSKDSLAEIYEKEFLKQKEILDRPEEVVIANEIKESPEQIEVQKSLKNLFHKLDTLSNLHFTPKVLDDVETKFVSNVPAALSEDITPLAFNKSSQMAPKEFSKKPVKKRLIKNKRIL